MNCKPLAPKEIDSTMKNTTSSAPNIKPISQLLLSEDSPAEQVVELSTIS